MATMEDWDKHSTMKSQSFSSSKVIPRSTADDEIDDYFKPILARVLGEKQFGINMEPIELKKVTASCEDGRGDRFSLAIPYANQKLEWIVTFNSQYPDESPDFEFGDKVFLADPSFEIIQDFVPGMVEWNHLDHDCLLRVLSEFIVLFKKHQIDQMALTDTRLVTEYQNLISQTEICEEDVELLLLPDRVQPDEAHFLIRIAMDFSRLPGRHAVQGVDAAILLVTFTGPRWNRPKSQLFLSKNLEESLGSANFHLPPFPPDKYLMDYIPEVKKFISEKIEKIVVNFEMKNRYIKTVVCLQGASVLEYDTVDFSWIVFLLNHRDFFFLVHISLSPKFPTEQPKISMQSVYHMSSKMEPYKQVLTGVPYSPRWEPEIMLMRALTQIIPLEIQKFQKSSTQKFRRG